MDFRNPFCRSGDGVTERRVVRVHRSPQRLSSFDHRRRPPQRLMGLRPARAVNPRPAGAGAMEAPSGFEPLHRSFADCSLNHLGTAPAVAL